MLRRNRLHSGRRSSPAIHGRDVEAEPIPEGSGASQFDAPEAIAITAARLRHLESLGLPLADRTVFEVGAGVGHLGSWFAARGCHVVSTDARPYNVEMMRELHPELESRVLDVESDDVADLGSFDVVFCYGLLYHLENPLLALRKLTSVCNDLMLIETQICDSPAPVLRLEDEYKSASQALRGIANKPSPSYVAMALNRLGFANVYAAAEPPDHPDYRFTYRGDLATSRGGHLLRGVYVASRSPIDSGRLIPLIRTEMTGGSA
jgi:SAM-dependent methyltransferase